MKKSNKNVTGIARNSGHPLLSNQVHHNGKSDEFITHRLGRILNVNKSNLTSVQNPARSDTGGEMRNQPPPALQTVVCRMASDGVQLQAGLTCCWPGSCVRLCRQGPDGGNAGDVLQHGQTEQN